MRIGLLIAASLTILAPAARAQSQPAAAAVAFPATERGTLARQWLETYNAGDVAAYRKFMETNAETGGTPVDARGDRTQGPHRQRRGRLRDRHDQPRRPIQVPGSPRGALTGPNVPDLETSPVGTP